MQEWAGPLWLGYDQQGQALSDLPRDRLHREAVRPRVPDGERKKNCQTAPRSTLLIYPPTKPHSPAQTTILTTYLSLFHPIKSCKKHLDQVFYKLASFQVKSFYCLLFKFFKIITVIFKLNGCVSFYIFGVHLNFCGQSTLWSFLKLFLS